MLKVTLLAKLPHAIEIRMEQVICESVHRDVQVRSETQLVYEQTEIENSDWNLGHKLFKDSLQEGRGKGELWMCGF